MAKYFIGRPDPSGVVMPNFLAVCGECAKKIVHSLPDELLPFLPEKPDVVKKIGKQFYEMSDALIDELLFVLQSDNPAYCHDVARKFREIVGVDDSVATIKELREQHCSDGVVTQVTFQYSEEICCDFPGCGRKFDSQRALMVHQRKHKE